MTSAMEDPIYAGYENWKGWEKTFSYTSDDASYFVGEMRGLCIKNVHLLEIGFGSGNFLAWAIEQGAHVAGTEINARSLEAARTRQIELLDANVEHEVISHAGRFETIVAFDVFEHFTVDEVRLKLKAACDLLAPGGALLLRFPNSQSPFGLAPQNGDPTHRSALSRSAVEQLMQGTSFHVQRYGPSFRVRSGSIAQRAARNFRAIVRDLISRFLNFIYTQDIPWDPVVVMVLRKASTSEPIP
jgi:SAM-dependent methyltransferase